MPVLMPLNCRIHFKTAFDFVANEGEDPMNVIRLTVYNWVKKHKAIGEDTQYQLYQTWFMKGDSEQHNINKAFIRTASNYGRYSKDAPEHWVMEFIHEDDRFSERIWSVNVGLARLDENRARFSCIVRYAIKENYIGSIPELPIPTVPKFVSNIIDSGSGKCFREISHIHRDPVIITLETVDNFLESLQDGNRYLPFVIIPLGADAADDLSPIKMQRHIAGNANVFSLDNDAIQRFNYIMPYKLRLRRDMVRIYFNIRENDDGRRHRFFLLENNEPTSLIKEYIITALARNARNFKLNELYEIKQIIFLRDQWRIEQLKSSIDNKDKDEMIALYSREIENLQKRFSDAEELLKLYEEENQTLTEKNRTNSWKLTDYKNRLDENSMLRKQLEATSKKFSLPENINSCLCLAEEFYSSRIVVHDNAKKSAKDFAKKAENDIIRECWEILSAIAFDLYDLKFVEQNTNLRDVFSQKTGISFSMTESSTTKKEAAIVKTRKLMYHGKVVEFFPHFRCRADSNFRIHIAFLDDEQKILICHCGEHLTNAMTRHLK